MIKQEFFIVFDWVYSRCSKGVDHVSIDGKVYWIDTTDGRNEVFKLFLKEQE